MKRACAAIGLGIGALLTIVWFAIPVQLAFWVQGQREAARCEADMVKLHGSHCADPQYHEERWSL